MKHKYASQQITHVLLNAIFGLEQLIHVCVCVQFGMFAGGLDMFGSTDESDDNENEPEDANAGIEITLMDTQLRPYVFFTSKSELMGHVWSGTASERTTALQVGRLLAQLETKLL